MSLYYNCHNYHCHCYYCPSSSREEDYFSLGDIIICLLDILLSVRDFCQVTIIMRLTCLHHPPQNTWESITQLLEEFYLQLTTISWLSVRQEASREATQG